MQKAILYILNYSVKLNYRPWKWMFWLTETKINHLKQYGREENVVIAKFIVLFLYFIITTKVLGEYGL